MNKIFLKIALHSPFIDALHVTAQDGPRCEFSVKHNNSEGNFLKAFGIINVLNSDENVPSPSSVDDVSLGRGYKENQYLHWPQGGRRVLNLAPLCFNVANRHFPER